jgi:hypothetical protein
VTTEVQPREEPPEPAQWLLDASRRLAPTWLLRATVAAARRGGVVMAPDDPELAAMVDSAVEELLADLASLLATDVDEQRTNPLSLFRRAVASPTELLLRRGARPPAIDRFAAERFPDDVFGLGPASWSDVDPELHEPGITWGAWKAMTVLRRRREEGLR